MRVIYQWLLRLYPFAYRREFGEEMTVVFLAAQSATVRRGLLACVRFCLREISGLVLGACDEHLRSIGLSSDWLLLNARSLSMRSNFRYPRTTIVLMIVILGVVIGCIEKARSIVASIPHQNPPLPPIHPVPFASPQALVLTVIATYILGAAVWALVFALRRSGVHRLSEAETWTRH